MHKDNDWQGSGKADAWIKGFEQAERQFYEIDDGNRQVFENPFQTGSQEHDGFEEGVYTFTQK